MASAAENRFADQENMLASPALASSNSGNSEFQTLHFPLPVPDMGARANNAVAGWRSPELFGADAAGSWRLSFRSRSCFSRGLLLQRQPVPVQDPPSGLPHPQGRSGAG